MELRQSKAGLPKRRPNDGSGKLVWQNLVAMAWQNRVGLVSTFTAPILGGETPVPAMTFKPKDEQPKIPGIEQSKDHRHRRSC